MIWQQDQLLQAGKYRIIRQIGYGGFGLTYLAEDYSVKRQVVIKAPNPSFQTDQNYKKFTKRFQREAEALAKISHLNIVQFIEFFKEAGIPCLVMAYVDGETLNERIRHQGRLSEAEAVEYFRKLAIALQTVHKIGLIHYDIHPGNIMLQRLSNEPVLIDFGSAKFLQPTTVTITTTVNDFAPYEQRQESKRKPTLDVYGLAATLYFAVTGEKPKAAFDRKIDRNPLKPPQKYCPELSNWLNQAILKGMALEPENRPQSMQEWLSFLYPLQSTQPKVKLLQFILIFIPLIILFLGYLIVGSILELSTVGLWTQVITIAIAWASVLFVFVVISKTGTNLIVICAVAVAFVSAWTGIWTAVLPSVRASLGDGSIRMAGILAIAGLWVLILVWLIELLKKRYNLKSIFIILGTTSSLGLILGSVLGRLLKALAVYGK